MKIFKSIVLIVLTLCLFFNPALTYAGKPIAPGQPITPGKPISPGTPITPGQPIKDHSTKNGKTNEANYTWDQKITHVLKDSVDWFANLVNDSGSFLIDLGNKITNFPIDLFDKAIDFTAQQIDGLSSSILSTLESIRSQSFDILAKSIDYAHSDEAASLGWDTPLMKLFVTALGNMDSQSVSTFNDNLHDKMESFINGKEQVFKDFFEGNHAFWDQLKQGKTSIADFFNNTLNIAVDIGERNVKTQIDSIFSYFDFHANERPYGTINDIKVKDQDLMTFAELAYSMNENQQYESAKNSLDQRLIPKGFREDQKLGKSDLAGFSGKTFVNSKDKQIVIAFRGTEPNAGDWRDFLADFALVFGLPNFQLSEGKDYVRTVLDQYPGYDVVLVGHSLGGNLAQGVGQYYKIPTVTFNGPGMQIHESALKSYPDFLKKWLDPSKNSNFSPFINGLNKKGVYDNLVINHIHSQDEIGKLGTHVGKTYVYYKDPNTGKLKIYESDDYGSSEISEDEFLQKISRTYEDGKNGLKHHGIDTFKEFLQDGNLRRKDSD